MKTRKRARLRTELSAVALELSDMPLTLVIAPGGSGKTTLARDWQDQLASTAHPMAWLTLADLHADLPLFLEDLVDAIRSIETDRTPNRLALPELKDSLAAEAQRARFGESIERLLLSKVELNPTQILRRLTLELRARENPLILCLDAYEHLPSDGAPATLVEGLLQLDPCPIRLVLTTRGSRPVAATSLVAAGRAIEIRADALDLRTAQITDVLLDSGVDPAPALVAGLLGRTRGWAIAVRLIASSLSSRPKEEHLEMVRQLGGQRDLFAYIGSELLGQASPEALEILETSARIGAATEAILIASADPGLDPRRGLTEVLAAGLMISEGDRLSLHDLWRAWLESPLRSGARPVDESFVRLRIGHALERIGEFERALGQFLKALPSVDGEDSLARILSRHGHDWVSVGHASVVEPALAALPVDRVRSSASLTALEGLVLAVRDPARAIEHLRTAAQSYREAGQGQEEAECLHDLGIVAFNENRDDILREIRGRMFTVLRSGQAQSIRGIGTYALGVASLLSRRFSTAVRLLDAARAYDQPPREMAGIGVNQSEIMFFQGKWEETYKRIEVILERPEQRQHGPSYFTLCVFEAVIDSCRDIDPDRQTVRLEEASDFFTQCHLLHARLRTDLSLAHHLLRGGDRIGASARIVSAEAIARRIELWEAVAASAGAYARLRFLEGDLDGARTAAMDALRVLDRPDAWSVMQRGKVHCYFPGMLLACYVLADVGEGEHAWKFLQLNRRRLGSPALPVCQQAYLFARAHVADRNGDSNERDSAFREAWRVAERANIEGFAPEIDEAMLREAVEAAKRLGMSGALLDKAAGKLRVAAPPALAIRTLGGFDVSVRGRRVADRAWRGVTSRRLLARLLIADQGLLSRERLETSLWPDALPKKARNNLRAALLRLRDVLEPRRRRHETEGLVLVQGDRVGLSAAVVEAWDVYQCRAAFARARNATKTNHLAEMIEALDEAETLDRGELFPGLDDDWVLEERVAFERARTDLGLSLGDVWLARGESGGAIRCARMVLARDSTDEPSWTLLVRAHVEAGDILGARRVMEEARSQLARDGDLTPGRELQELLASL